VEVTRKRLALPYTVDMFDKAEAEATPEQEQLL